MDFMTAHRMKVLAFALLYLLGCNTPDVPDGPSEPIAIPAPAFNDDQDILAVTLAQHTDGVTPNPGPAPGPVNPDKPKVGDKCEECRGTGQLGDSTIFRPCPQCKADGILHEGDPGLLSSSQKKPLSSEDYIRIYVENEEAISEIWKNDPNEGTLKDAVLKWLETHPEQASDEGSEQSIVVQFVRQDAFDQLVSETSESLEILESETKVKYDALVKDLNENNASLQSKFDEMTSRINQLEAELKALDEECDCDERAATPKETPEVKKTSFKINYKGADYIWDGDSSFVSNNGWKITYPHLKGATADRLSKEPPVRVCPEGEVCVEVKIESFDSSNLPNIKAAEPTTPPPPPVKEKVSYRGYPLRPQSTWWSGCGSWVHLTRGEHYGQFNPDWLRTLSWPELQSLHSDAHDHRVKWSYVVR